MRSTMIPARWDTASRAHRTRSSDAARSSFRREQTSADCTGPTALPQPCPLPCQEKHLHLRDLLRVTRSPHCVELVKI